MTIEELKKRKIELGYTNENVSALSGVPLSTVQKFFGTTTAAPRYKTIQAITHALFPDGIPGETGALSKEFTALLLQEKVKKKAAQEDSPIQSHQKADRPSRIAEPSVAFRADTKTRNTLDDYYALPDELRVELIDGVFYDMATPTFIHQQILLEIAIQLKECVSKHGMSCLVCIAPQDVQLDKDIYTMLQPDVFVVCDRTKIQTRSLYGAPDFAIEVLSPSTRWKDLTLKLNKYKNAGVREYWIVDPDDEMVVVYFFEEDDLPRMQERGKPVPVRISEGRCEVDFSRIWDAVAPLKQG